MPISTINPASISGLGYGFKNRIINGDMRIDQRNAGASVTPTTTSVAFPVDRWAAPVSQSSKFSVQQNAGAVTPPVGFSNYLGVTSLSAYSVLTGDYFALWQPIEGFNCADFAWGTANAQAVTVSFWARSSLTGTFGGAVENSAQNRAYPFTYTISAANTWEYKTVTIPGDTSGTWLTNNSVGLYLVFGLGVGSTYSGTAGAWTGSQKLSATGAVSVVGTSGATFYITGVQLEAGVKATGFDYRPYGLELAMCQRYFFKTYDTNTAPATVTNAGALGALTNASGYTVVPVTFPVCMRAGPTVTFYNATSGASGTWRDGGGVSLTMGAGSTGTSSFYAYNYTASANSTAAGHLIASAEL